MPLPGSAFPVGLNSKLRKWCPFRDGSLPLHVVVVLRDVVVDVAQFAALDVERKAAVVAPHREHHALGAALGNVDLGG
jgi:hypothetical protein